LFAQKLPAGHAGHVLGSSHEEAPLSEQEEPAAHTQRWFTFEAPAAHVLALPPPDVQISLDRQRSHSRPTRRKRSSHRHSASLPVPAGADEFWGHVICRSLAQKVSSPHSVQLPSTPSAS